jgi:hypothetical protein
MMDLIGIEGIGKALEWFVTLGRSELRQVRGDAEELLGDLRKSLVNLWDVATEVTRPEPSDLTMQTFQPVYDYFTRFYLNPENISAARTHCGYVERDIDRLTFKLGTLLHSDLGRWSEAKMHLSDVIANDVVLVTAYDRSIAEIHQHLQAIDIALRAGDVATARTTYAAMRKSLRPDIQKIEKFVAAMEKANQHLWSVTG